MCYSIEPRDRIYIKSYEFLSFAKNIGKNLSSKYSQKLLNSAKKSTTDTIKTASKRAIQKSTKATGDLIGNKIVDKITIVSKKIFTKRFEDRWEWIRNTKKDIYLRKKDKTLLIN